MLLIIDPRKLHRGHLFPQKRTKRPPAVLELVLEQPLRRRDPPHERVMVPIHIPCLVSHLLLGRRLPPSPNPPVVRVPHGPDDPRIPIAQEVQKRAPRRFDDGLVEARVPRFDVPLHEDDFRFRVRGHELLREGHGGEIGRDGAKGAEQGVPFRPGEGGSLGEELGVLGHVPGGAIAQVGEPESGMVAFVAEDVARGLQSCWARDQKRINQHSGGIVSWAWSEGKGGREGRNDGGSTRVRLTHGARAREAQIHDFHRHGSDAALAIDLKIGFEKLGVSFLDGCHCRWVSERVVCEEDTTTSWLRRIGSKKKTEKGRMITLKTTTFCVTWRVA